MPAGDGQEEYTKHAYQAAVVETEKCEHGAGEVTPSQIDAQGHDASVLRGAKALLAERRAFIVVFEVSPEPNHKLVETLPHSPDHDPNWARCRLASRAT